MSFRFLKKVIQRVGNGPEPLRDNSEYIDGYWWAGHEVSIRYAWSWVLGKAPYQTWFNQSSDMVRDIVDHEGVQAARKVVREEIANHLLKSTAIGGADVTSKVKPYSLAGPIGILVFIRDYATLATMEQYGGNLTVTFLGSYQFKRVVVSNIDATTRTADVYFQIFNTTGLESATRIPGVGYVGSYMGLPTASAEDIVTQLFAGKYQPSIPKSLLNDRKGRGMLTNCEQYIHWGERLSF